MSAEPDDAYRSVSRPSADSSNLEMSVIGWVIFLGLVVLLLPLLPFLVAIWLLGKLLDQDT